MIALAGALALLYVGLAALLFFTQESTIFHPGPNDAGLRARYDPGRARIPTPRGATLEGWWVENPAATHDRVILYFGGNAEDVLYSAGTLPMLSARRMLVVNYPGYGTSTGRPGQDALYDYGLAVYEHAIHRGAQPDQIVVMGRSLGSAVASMLAAARPVKAAVLITPFDNLAAVAAFHYPYFPVRMLLRHPFPSADWARQAQVPALILAAARDDVIPPAHAERLAQAWAGTAEFHVLSGMGHNDIEDNPVYYRWINEFLERQ